MALTNTAVKQAKSKDRSYKIFDGGGLYLEVMKNGSKYWRMKYRFAKKENRLAFGIYPEVTLKEARVRRVAARKLLRGGIDPSEHKKAANKPERVIGLKIIAVEY